MRDLLKKAFYLTVALTVVTLIAKLFIFAEAFGETIKGMQ